MVDFATQRLNMVEGQLRPSRVLDPRVLAAAGDIPRERFAPEPLRGSAYADEDLPLGGGRFLIEPLILSRLIQAADVAAEDTALTVGCATGYGAAMLARLAKSVIALECDAGLVATARDNLRFLGVMNVGVVAGPLDQGWRAEAPYRVIVVEGAVHDLPATLTDQLAEGGRLVAVRRRGPSGKAVVVRKVGGVAALVELFDAPCPILPGFAREPGFVF